MKRIPSPLIRAFLATAIVSVTMVLSAAGPAHACSCVGFVEALDFSDEFAAVFVGEVVDRSAGDRGEFGDEEVRLVFAVETLYHGDLSDRALLHSYADNGGNCGFSGAGRVAVLAYVNDEQQLRTDGCSATPVGGDGVIEAALARKFGPGIVPPAATVDPADALGQSNGSGTPWLAIGGGVGFAVVLLGSFVWILRGERTG